MASVFKVIKGLEELCKLPNISLPKRNVPDYRALYREVIPTFAERFELNDDEVGDYLQNVVFLYYVESKKTASTSHVITYLLGEICDLWSKDDRRDQSQVIYRPEVVILVVLLAQMGGCTTCDEYEDYCFNNKPNTAVLHPRNAIS